MSEEFDKWDRTLTGSLPVHDLPRLVRSAILEQVLGPGSPQRHYLAGDPVIVGRSEGAIRVSSAELSRAHMRIERIGPEYVCTDLNSRNGVYLNGLRIHSAVLREGDRLQLGDVVFVFHAGGI